MNTDKIGAIAELDRSTLLFLLGLSVVMLAMWFPFIPDWQTFIHMWRVETGASLLLLIVLAWTLRSLGRHDRLISLSTIEWRLIVLPIAALIVWSGLSAIWAPSWKSALHHAFIWSEYLIFYFIFRSILERGRGFAALLSVFAGTIVLYALPAILEYCAYLSMGGATSLGIRFAKYGEQVVAILPLLLLATLRCTGRRFAIGAIVVSLLWLLVFCSLGRANMMLFAAVVGVMFVLTVALPPYRRYVPRFAILVAIMLLAPLPLQLFSASTSSAPTLSRLAGNEHTAGSNNFRKLMSTLAVEMVRSHPLKGIGADNFGMQVNNYRQAYGAANPSDINLATAEDQIPGNAHNELLQIAAELGTIGIAIVVWLLAGIGLLSIRAIQRLGARSMFPLAALVGAGAFLISSLVSAYSFRSMQNGIVFFFLLAVAVKTLRLPATERSEQRYLTPLRLRLACIAGIVACVGLLGYTSLRLSSVIVTAKANHTRPTSAAMPLYELAMKLDDENPDARHNLGMRLFRRTRYAEAIPHLEAAIRIGRAPASEFSYLGTAKTLIGAADDAEQTMRVAAEMYPRSPFVLARYSTLLEANQKTREAELIFERATAISPRLALTWRTMIMSGPKVLSEMAARDTAYIQVSELRPEAPIYAVVTERYIKFPEEQRFSLFRPLVDDE